MAGVIRCFRDEFLPVHQNDEYVDLSSLVEKFKNFTPIPLRCTKPEESVQYVISEKKRISFSDIFHQDVVYLHFRNMPAVVIMNFSSHYGEKLKISFPNKGFTALANIVQRNGSDIHTRAQLTLMVHITKMEIKLWLAVLLFMKIEVLFVHTSLTQQLEQWKSIVLKTIDHPQVSSNKQIAMRVRVMKVRIGVWCHFHPFTKNLSDMGLSNSETKLKFTYLKS